MASAASSSVSSPAEFDLGADSDEGTILRASLNALIESNNNELIVKKPDAYNALCYKIKPCGGLSDGCTKKGTYRYTLLVDPQTKKARQTHIIFCDVCWAENNDSHGLDRCRTCKESIGGSSAVAPLIEAYQPGDVVMPHSDTRTFRTRMIYMPEVYHCERPACGIICDACCRFVQGPVPDWAVVRVEGLLPYQSVCFECRSGGTDEEFIARNALFLSSASADVGDLSGAKGFTRPLKPGVRTVPQAAAAPVATLVPVASVATKPLMAAASIKVAPKPAAPKPSAPKKAVSKVAAPTTPKPAAPKKRASEAAPKAAKRSA